MLLNKGNGTFLDGAWVPLPNSGNCGAAADFNLDGKPDLAMPTTSGLTIMLGTGLRHAPYTTGPTTSMGGMGCPITGDINGDGIPDILVGANSLNGVGAYLGNGDGTFRLAGVIPVGPAVNLILADFNHDGKLDFVDSNGSLAYGNGDGTFQPYANIPLPQYGFVWMVTGDFNNDGWPDLLGINSMIGTSMCVLLNNQQGGFTTSLITNLIGNDVEVSDLNGDGSLDAVVDGDGYADIFLGDGHGGFSPGQQRITYPIEHPSPLWLGDVNGDGIPDILLPNGASIGIALGNGDGTFTNGPVFGVGPGSGQVFMQNLYGQPATPSLPDLVAPSGNGGIMVLFNRTK